MCWTRCFSVHQGLVGVWGGRGVVSTDARDLLEQKHSIRLLDSIVHVLEVLHFLVTSPQHLDKYTFEETYCAGG